MNTEIETLKQEMNKIESTFIPTGDVVKEQKLLIEAQEQLLELTNKEIEEIKSLAVLDEADKNDLYCTNDVNVWLETVKQIDINNNNKKETGLNPDRVPDLWLTECFDFNFDYETVKGASGYIISPVFKYNEKVEAVSYKIFKTMQDLREYLKGKKYLLHMIIVSVKTEGCDNASFVPYRLDNPELRYTFRGHILE